MTHYPHPKPSMDTFSQTLVLIGLGMMLISVIGVMALVLRGAPAGFLLMLPVIGGLALPLIMRLSVTPALTVQNETITIKPRFGKAHQVNWNQIEKVAPFPLLPSEDAEVVRRATVGKNNYAVAKGLMLIIPSLPARYRVAGWFAGEGGKPIIAITNRSHTHYDQLAQIVLNRTHSQSNHVG
jgi:hypothetical protein